MTVRMKGVVDDAPLTASCKPAGVDEKVSPTVMGSSRTVFVAVRPPASVAVSVSSRCEGYSWSGALNDPPATPGHVWMVWLWQFDGQCCITRVHDSPDAGRLPCSGSLA